MSGTVVERVDGQTTVIEVITAGPQGVSALLSDADPQPPGTADPGVSTAVSRADHVHESQPETPLSSATPAALGVAAAGVSTSASRGDHVHAMPSAAAVGADATGTAAAAVAAHVAAGDPHPQYNVSLSSATPAALGVAAAGAATSVSRSDHVHAIPSAAAVGADPAGTASAAITTHLATSNTFSAAQTVAIEDAGTNTVLAAKTLRRTSSGTPANGIGVGLNFEVETTASNVELGACIQAVTTDVTAATEDFDLVFKTMKAGAAAAEVARLLSTGVLSLPTSDGNAVRVSMANGGNVHQLFVHPNGYMALGQNGAPYFGISLSQTFPALIVNHDRGSGQIVFGSGFEGNSQWTAGFKRVADGVLSATNGLTGIGAWLSSKLVEANAAGSGAPNVLTALESGTVLTNEGVSAENYHTLPSAVAGLEYLFVIQDTDGMRITASTGDTIRPIAGTAASATGGFIRCATAGAFIRLLAINATEWIAVGSAGTWTIDA